MLAVADKMTTAVAFHANPLPISSFTARPEALDSDSALRNAPARREARFCVRLARSVDIVLGASLCALAVDVAVRRSDTQYHERVLSLFAIVLAGFLMVTAALPALAQVCPSSACRRHVVRASKSVRLNHAFFYDSAWRGHTYLFISVSCFPLAQSGGVVLGMMMLLSSLFNWLLHCAAPDAFAVVDGTSSEQSGATVSQVGSTILKRSADSTAM